MVTLSAPTVSDHVALAEIELCGELMIAASAAIGERLSSERIDEVLDVKVSADVRVSADVQVSADVRVSADRTTVPRQGEYRG
ncbi:hypothetical protein [Streptomyces sp. NBC_00525]|uniref:hypothetical protein n=1 Tax=Streptomyces sp. NBC_00525 TaxID=2903660 RepID=UPI003FCC586E